MQATNASRSPHYLANGLESQAVSGVYSFLSELEAWVSGEFQRGIILAPSGTPDMSDLVSSFRPWIDEIASLGNLGTLSVISPLQAAKLYSLVSEVLNHLQECCWRCGHPPSDMMLALSPIDDVLVFLSYRAMTDQ